ncbi:hypothetical protein [Sphingomonas sp. ERG5]|uniref:hypothetical protein n=1 Tax=Sphingomonas sp. ERG5 TaxID=1381597 RepID=UPI00054C7ED5|nr:hypothetical protein [Sphingomonas sp. ERG5]
MNGNATKIARFVERQCFGPVDDLGEFEADLKTIGWKAGRTHTANAANPLELDVWELPNAELLRGQSVKGVWTCALMVKPAVAPALNEMRSALSHVTKHAPDKNEEWWWTPSLTRRLHLTADREAGPAATMLINVEIYRLPWWRGVLE